MKQTWLKLPSNVSMKSEELAAQLEAKVRMRIQNGEFTEDEVAHVSKLDMRPVKELEVSKDQLEKLRRLCQVWDVDINPGEITSHRPVIGRFIIAGKRLLFPILKALLRNFISQQKEFNAAAISLLAELSSKKK